MRTFTKLGAFAAATAAATGLLIAPASAAAPTHPVLVVGGAGGSKIQAADGTVVSGLTAASGINTITVPASAHNEIASGSVGDLLDAGAVTTQEEATSSGSDTQITAEAHTANVSLLGGLITADAVDTTSTAATDGTSITSESTTTLLNLSIKNANVPVTIPQNFTIKLPGIALIVLNLNHVANVGNAASTVGAGVYVRLLGTYGQSPLGTQIFLNPTFAALTTHIPNTPVVVGGNAFGSRLSLHALNLVGIESGPTAQQTLRGGGTDGVTRTNSTAGVHIPDVLSTGVIKTTVEGAVTNTNGNGRTTASIARLNLLDGLIKAKALHSRASAVARANGTTRAFGGATFLGLSIGGQSIPPDTKPNTVINVAGLGRVVIDEVVANNFAVTVHALDIVLSTARAGLPVGTRIELGVASAYVIS